MRIPTNDDTPRTNEICPHTLLKFFTGKAVYNTTFWIDL